MKKIIRSRILETFPRQCLVDIYKICKSLRINNNNDKADAIMTILKNYKIECIELGPGTNRLGILINGYVYKIALDRWGIKDNLNDFTVSEELQPFVAKTYETNKLILVAEYVTVISKEEFREKRDEMTRILSTLAQGYLLGDVGLVEKNFCNWGYRDDGQLVILDYGYIHRIVGHEMLCSHNSGSDEKPIICGQMLEYDENFHGLYCPRCRKKYTFMDIRRKITEEYENSENNEALSEAYSVTEAYTEYEEEIDETSIEEDIDEFDFDAAEKMIKNKEDNKMKNYLKGLEDLTNGDEFSKEEQETAYARTMRLLYGGGDDMDENIISDMISDIDKSTTLVGDAEAIADEFVENLEEAEREDDEDEDTTAKDEFLAKMNDFIDSGDADEYLEEEEDEFIIMNNNGNTVMVKNEKSDEKIVEDNKNVLDAPFEEVDNIEIDVEKLKNGMTDMVEQDYSNYKTDEVIEEIPEIDMVDMINNARK